MIEVTPFIWCLVAARDVNGGPEPGTGRSPGHTGEREPPGRAEAATERANRAEDGGKCTSLFTGCLSVPPPPAAH